MSNQRRVVVVSSDLDFLRKHGSFLDRRETVVHHATDAIGFWQLLAKGLPDLVVVDAPSVAEHLRNVLEIVRTSMSEAMSALMVVLDAEESEASLPRWVGERPRTAVVRRPFDPEDLLAISASLGGWPQRRELRVQVEVHMVAASPERTVVGFTRDISEGGMCFVSDAFASPGEVVVCGFALPGGDYGDFSIPARVLRCHPYDEGFEHGLAFVRATAWDRQRIAAFIVGVVPVCLEERRLPAR